MAYFVTMKHWTPFLLGLATSIATAAPKVEWGHETGDFGFRLGKILPPATDDAATQGKWSVISGTPDGNSPGVSALSDGKIPSGPDDPRSNFFFSGNGGRVLLDLGKDTSILQLVTYSWHPGNRALQDYTVYGLANPSAELNPDTLKTGDPTSKGWKKIADVKAKSGDENGGQYAASIAETDASKPLGKYRYFLFDIRKPLDSDPHGNTFFAECDVIAAGTQAITRVVTVERKIERFKKAGQPFEYILDTTNAPDLEEWSKKELLPVIEEWYPKLVKLMPSKGYRAPESVLFEYRTDMGGTPAYAIGNRIALHADWFRSQLKGEAKGCVVHEMGHIVQNYWRAARTNPNPKPTPGWITEGICDYLRWFLYEPESRGAIIRRPEDARHDASYRVSANFIDWVVRHKHPTLLADLNAAAREGRYEPELWKKWTGMDLTQLEAAWKESIAREARRGQ